VSDPIVKSEQLNILYLAHDLTDATVHKRIQMLTHEHTTVHIMGFRRSGHLITEISRHKAIDWGQTTNAHFIHRAFSIFRIFLRLKQYQNLFSQADIIIARNLEMLILAVAGAKRQAKAPVIIYEILDIHRLLLGSGLISKTLRYAERSLLRSVKEIYTSSPAYITNYFQQLNPTQVPIRVIENKLLSSQNIHRPEINYPTFPPWIIGWFGIIRCKKSLDILAATTRKCCGSLKVVIRGKPALDQIPDFYEIIDQTPGLYYAGPYKNPEDLPSMYTGTHFNWVIDMYEQGKNSAWLLPNRLYEGGYFGAVPIALSYVETGHYLKKLGIGVLLSDPLSDSLYKFLDTLTALTYESLVISAKSVRKTQWLFTNEDTTEFIQSLFQIKKTNGIQCS
jgi:succinoglycan biosynthesis protein ExoL